MSLYDPSPPEDLDRFWTELVRQAEDLPLQFRRSNTNDFDRPGFKVESIEFSTVGARTLHGWLAYPPRARRLPGFVWIPPYGRESLLANEYGTLEGFTSLSFNFFGLPSFHQEKYVVDRGYFAEGAESPDTWIFRQMAQDAVVAARVLRAQVEVDQDRVAASGMSQGGGIAIWLGAYCSAVRAVCADMPFLCSMRETLSRTVYRYPLKELFDFAERIPVGLQRVENTVSYFDTTNLATRCRVPSQVSLGLRDPASRPENVRAAFDALACKKRLVTYDGGHDWTPPMIENNRNWLLENLA